MTVNHTVSLDMELEKLLIETQLSPTECFRAGVQLMLVNNGAYETLTPELEGLNVFKKFLNAISALQNKVYELSQENERLKLLTEDKEVIKELGPEEELGTNQEEDRDTADP